MASNVDAMIRAAIESIRAGKKTDARALLEKALEQDEYNEQAWMWLSGVVETPEEQRTCLDNVLIINPNNEQAKKGLKALGFDAPAPPAPVVSNELPQIPAFNIDSDDDMFADIDFGTPATSSSDKPAWDAGLATSSASAVYSGPQTSPSEYDNWLSGLNIGKTGATAPASSAFESTNAFGSEYDDDENFFGNQAPAVTASAPMTSAPANDPFGNAPFGDAFGDDPFASEMNYEEPEDDFNAPLSSTKSATYSPPSYANDDAFDDIISTPAGDDFDDLFKDDQSVASNAPSKTASKPARTLAPQDYFRQIPDEIDAGRLPGTNAKYPNSIKVGLVIAVLLNIGAFLFLILRMVG